MGKCVIDKNSSKILLYSRWDEPQFDTTTQVMIEVVNPPDKVLDRWDGVNGIRRATLEELALSEQEQISSKKDPDNWDKAIQAVVIGLVSSLNAKLPKSMRLSLDETKQAISDAFINM